MVEDVMLDTPSVRVVGIRMAAWASYTQAIYRGVLRFIRLQGGWQVKTPLDSTNEIEPVKIDRHWKGQGLILFRATAAEMRAFRQRGIAVVCISSESGHHDVPLIIQDNIETGRIAAHHLLSVGLRSFAFWGDQTRRYSRERGKGFSEVLDESGFQCLQIGFEASRVANNPHRWKRMRQAMIPQLQALPKPIGILAKDDIAAATLIDACQRLGYAVPDDVAVVGVNNDEMFCHTTAPPMTSIPYPGEAIGYQAAYWLEQLMRDPSADVPRETLVPVCGIADRESTDVLHIQDKVVSEAVRRIRREGPTYPLQVNELVASLPLSRAAFKRRFADAVGMSPKAEIKRVRLAFLKEMLRTTDWPVKRIAEHMKFDSVEELGRFMRRETAMTASEFRKRDRARFFTPIEADAS